MASLQLIAQAPGHYAITGQLTYACIDKHTVKSLTFQPGQDKVSIDLAAVTATDSAGLALMIEWIKLSRNNRVQIHFINIPEQILALAKLSGLDNNEYFASVAPRTACTNQ